MKRTAFIQIIKLRSVWKVNKRQGNYSLPSGEKLSVYIRKLVESQMELDNLAIAEDGDLYWISEPSYWDEFNKEFTDIEISIPYNENETCSFDEQERRISELVREITG